MRLYVLTTDKRFVLSDSLTTTVSVLLPFLRASRFSWYVFTLGERYFILRDREVRATLMKARQSRVIADVLHLNGAVPSHMLRSNKKWLELEEIPPSDQAASRVALIAKRRGNDFLTAIGTIQKNPPRTLTSSTFVARQGGAAKKVAKKAPAKKAAAKKAVARVRIKRAPAKHSIGGGSDFRRTKSNAGRGAKGLPAMGVFSGSDLSQRESNQPSSGSNEPSAKMMPEPYEIVDVFYATDREPEVRNSDDKPLKYLNHLANKAKLSYGVCKVTIPADHRLGKLESPSIFRLEIREDPAKHFTLLDCYSMNTKGFFDEVKTVVDKGVEKSAFVFIHGFNVNFVDAAKSTAQLTTDMRFQGVPILYSWASAAHKRRYAKDEETVELTVKRLKSFLEDLCAKSGTKTIHLIAHSMGNRALVKALAALHANTISATKLFKQVVLTAPDVPRQDVENLIDAASVNAERITLYASKKDKALLLSKGLHDYERLGFVYKKFPFIISGMDSIDASSVKTDFLAHSVFAKTRTVLTDLSELIRHGEVPGKRFGLKDLATPDGLCWTFKK